LPGRYWKWRMHGAAVTLARQFLAGDSQPDLILATDMLDLTTFLALTRRRSQGVPAALYLHENQLTYPLPVDGANGPMRRQMGERDLHYAFINYASMLAADRVFFNSHFHQESFLAALPNFLKHFPDYNELDTILLLEARSQVLPVGIDLRRFGRGEATGKGSLSSPEHYLPVASPLLLWNQRWEYDKNPAAFFQALYTIAAEGIPFRLALCGENFRRRPAEFEEALTRLADHIIFCGYASEEQYRELLWQAAVTISTADHEFFGISILEAIYCHTFPILPHRLSYPELIPEPFHLRCLYENQGGLVERLRWALTHPREAAEIAASLAEVAAGYDWSAVASEYDQALANL
ncbi:MAG: DUF3524 domain-containing protein, partial [Chloroflexota bacterium]